MAILLDDHPVPGVWNPHFSHDTIGENCRLRLQQDRGIAEVLSLPISLFYRALTIKFGNPSTVLGAPVKITV